MVPFCISAVLSDYFPTPNDPSLIQSKLPFTSSQPPRGLSLCSYVGGSRLLSEVSTKLNGAIFI